VPATAEGIPAIEVLINEGINVNVTLMFSLMQYDAVAEAYIAGLEHRAAAGLGLSRIASVASFFVSRVDTKVDGLLDALGTAEARSLRGTTGIANAKMAYQRFREAFSGERWERLAALGARVQRPLWASTGTKDPAYPDTLYADALIGAHTVNTLPPDTLAAVLDHGAISPEVEADLSKARAQLEKLTALGIDLDAVTDVLLDEGIDKFVQPFGELLRSVSQKCRMLGLPRFEARLGAAQPAVDAAVDEIAQDDVMARLWDLDYHLWADTPTEISNRLGWLTSPAVMRRHLEPITDFVDEVRQAGYTDAVLLGMGGSSLGPDMFSAVFGPAEGYLRLMVIDSTDPGAVLTCERRLDLAKTLFIASSKSGTTVETLSGLRYYYNAVQRVVGSNAAGEHFIAITDPGTPLVAEARSLGFRTVFENIPTIGGRYSALSFFGLVPAGLLGINLDRLLDRALGFADIAPDSEPLGDTAAVELGAILAELTKAGRDKLTLVASLGVEAFGDWVEQLVAESTGKGGVGVLPVVGESLGSPAVYGADRLFVHLRLDGAAQSADDSADAGRQNALAALAEAGHPVITMHLRDIYDIGEQIFLWEMAVAVAGHLLGIQPFDQPNVEAAKILARKMTATYQETGSLPAAAMVEASGSTLRAFLSQTKPGDYVALQAYVEPTAATTEALQELRIWMRDAYRVATTVGYGPRYLHSTGQLHKGDAGNGLFIQFTAKHAEDAAIPDRAGDAASVLSFGVLEHAQALGDYWALVENQRRVIHFRLGVDVAAELAHLLTEVSG
jgi:transaldolase/glucose-6-phosphate isomerase